MKPSNLRRPLLPGDVQRCPQLPVLVVLRTAATSVVPALLHAHPALAHDEISSSVELAADNVVRLAERLRIAIDNYRRALADTDPF